MRGARMAQAVAGVGENFGAREGGGAIMLPYPSPGRTPRGRSGRILEARGSPLFGSAAGAAGSVRSALGFLGPAEGLAAGAAEGWESRPPARLMQ